MRLHHITYAAFVCMATLSIVLSQQAAFAEKCYMKKDGFAVEQPYMVTKGCFLFHHSANVDLVNQSDLVITRKEQLHPDPIHREFLRFILERKLITLPKGTPLFSCAYDLETVATDFKLTGNQGGSTRTIGYDLPSFNCAAVTSMWTPVRPLNESKCYWIAVPLLACDLFGRELQDLSTDALLDEEE